MSLDDRVSPLNNSPHSTGLENSSDLIQICRKIVSKRLTALVHNLFDNTDDALFELADKAETNAIQCLYFDSMRIVRFKRQEIEDAFNNNIIDQFHKLRLSTESSVSLDNISLEEFSLIQECDLEETLAIDGLIGKVKNRQHESLFAIEQRFAEIVTDISITEENNPFGPLMICNSFSDALSVLDVELKIKLLIYKLFDKHVIKYIGDLYDEINTLFINAGILPKLKFQLNHTQNNHVAAQPDYIHAAVHESNQTTVQPSGLLSDNNAPDHVLQNLHQLLMASRGGASHAANSPVFSTNSDGEHTTANNNPHSHAEIGDILTALSTIQLSTGHMATNSANVLSTETIKNTLITQFQSMENTGPIQNIKPLDSDIIDVITMMFDFILEDHQLPNVIVTMIVRLQIPMLKVALQDRSFFANKNHPARRLLNTIAKSGVGLSDENCLPGNILFDKLTDTTNTIINDFKSDITLFEKLVADLDMFLVDQDELARKKNHKQIESYKQREQVKLASDWVKFSINEQLLNKKIPATVSQFLHTLWKNVLLKTYLEKGENSRTWKKQLKFVNILAWSVETKSSASQRQRLASVILSLLDMLKSGLKTISYPEQGVDKILLMLEEIHLHNFHSDNEKPEIPANSKTDFSDQSTLVDIHQHDDIDLDREMDELAFELDAANNMGIKDPVIENIVLSDYQHEQQDLPQDEYLQLARHLEAGRWVEFNDEKSRPQRAKLAWKSDLLGEYTFINWRFQVVADKTLGSLADDLRCGNARIIDDVPIFDKALGAVVDGLKKHIA